MFKTNIGDMKKIFSIIGLFLSYFSIAKAVSYILNDLNILHLNDEDNRVTVKQIDNNVLSLSVDGRTLDPILKSGPYISSSLDNKFRDYVVFSPELSKNNKFVKFKFEDTSINYRIPTDKEQDFIYGLGAIRLDYRSLNIWNYQTQQAHMILSGATGSGKSQALIAYINALLLQNAEFTFIDPKCAELTTLGHNINIPVAHTWNDAFNALQNVDELLTDRQKNKESTTPYFLVMEEVAALLTLAPSTKDKQSFQSLFKKILVTARSENVHIISVMQTATAENVGGIELRSQYGIKILLGSPQPSELQFLFPAGTQAFSAGKFSGQVYIDGYGINRIDTPSKYSV